MRLFGSLKRCRERLLRAEHILRLVSQSKTLEMTLQRMVDNFLGEI